VDSLNDQGIEPDARIGGIVDGRYKILEAMASGSMGVVYKAERVPVGKLVAIKFLHASFAKDSEFIARFERETRVMSKLAHPNCVSVVDFGVWDGSPYLVMEYVAGTTLRAMIDKEPIPPQRALLLARQIAAGLAHAHAQDIVHRDVKPANIMISEAIGTGEHVRILDFGLARLRGNVGRDATQINVVVGTPNYMAPEQTIGGGLIDARTDIYAVGVVLFEMISGERPYSSEDTMTLLGMHRAAPIPKLSDRIDHSIVLPLGVQALIEKAMAKSPDDRFQSAVELANAIDEILGPRVSGEHEIVSPRRLRTDPAAVAPTVVDLSSGATRRHHETLDEPPARRGGVGTFLLLLVLLGGAGAAVWHFKLRDNPSGARRPTGELAKGGATSARSGAPVAAPADARSSLAARVPLDAGPGAQVLVPDAAVALLDAGAAPLDASALSDAAALGDANLVPGTLVATLSASGDAGIVPAGADAGVGEVHADEIEIDPSAAVNPDPEADSNTAEDEAPDAPRTAADVEKKIPKAPVRARTVAEAVQMIKAGKRDLALASLHDLWKKTPKSAYIPFLLGNLYFDRLWWGVALDHYKAAIAKNAEYKKNSVLNKNVIKMLGSSKTVRKAQGFLRWTVGRAALPYLRSAAKSHENATVRKRAAALAKQIR